MSIVSDEGQMNAACLMRDAADRMARSADRIEEATRQISMLFDGAYGGTASQLLDALQDAARKQVP